MAKVIYRDTRGVRRNHVLESTTSIGRHPEQDIQLLDRVVSKNHAVIEQDIEGQFLIRDCGSRNGTFLNGDPVDDKASLQNGDTIAIGSTDLTFREDLTRKDSQNKVTIHADEHDSHIQNRIAQGVEDRFLPENRINDTDVLRRDYEKLRIAHELSQSIGVETDLDVLLEKILDKAFELFPADHGVILMRLEDSERMVPMVVRGSNEDSLDVGDVRISQTILNEVIEEKQAVLSSDAMKDDRFSGAHSIILGNIRSTMSVPLLMDDKILGVIHLDSTVESGAFTEKDLQILTGFARQAAMLINHHRLIKKMEEEIVVREKLHRLLSPQLVEEVVSGRRELKKGGQLRRATIMFADIRNFTSFSEQHTPQEVVEVLNEYFELMVDVIFKHEGTLDKFIGDEVMAIWGAPIGHDDDTERAVRCAVEMQEALQVFNDQRQGSDQTLRVGIGLNTGEVVAGYMGSTKSMNYTVMGDAANTANRICSTAGPGDIIIGPDTFQEVKNLVTADKLPPTELKGKSNHVDMFRVRGLRRRPMRPTLRNPSSSSSSSS